MKNEKSTNKNESLRDTIDFWSIVGQNTTFPSKILAHRT